MSDLSTNQFGPELSDQDKSYLDFETSHPGRYSGNKETQVIGTFGHSYVRYAQRINHIMDHPRAAVEYPDTVARLQKQRDAARARRNTIQRVQ